MFPSAFPAINISCECQLFQALIRHYLSRRYQVFLSDSMYKYPNNAILSIVL